MKKRIALFAMLFLLFSLCLLLASCTEQGFEYKLYKDGTALVCRYVGDETDVVIPAEIRGHRVRYVWGAAFRENTDIVSVTVPEGVEYIGPLAFYKCTSLKEISLPSTLKTVDFHAFGDFL